MKKLLRRILIHVLETLFLPIRAIGTAGLVLICVHQILTFNATPKECWEALVHTCKETVRADRHFIETGHFINED